MKEFIWYGVGNLLSYFGERGGVLRHQKPYTLQYFNSDPTSECDDLYLAGIRNVKTASMGISCTGFGHIKEHG